MMTVSICSYASPLGGICLAADALGLTGLWFDGEKYFGSNLPANPVRQETEILTESKRWLDVYFSGREPDFLPPLHPIGSPQAVGGAVGHNEISILIPCHRVVGTNGSLTGYAGGVDKKERLLTLEGVDMRDLFRPAKGTAL